MYTTDDIREIDFSTSMSGYKKSEVDDFLDQLADDYDNLLKENQQLKEQIQNGAVAPKTVSEPVLETKVTAPAEPDPAVTENVQNIITSAQRFSDQLIFEAKQKAETLLTDAAVKAKEIEDKIAVDKAESDESIAKLKQETEETVSTVLKGANDKSESIVLAAKDSVERQQLLFDKLRVEADLFKTKLVESYKKQLELLVDFPTEVPFDAVHASQAVEFIVDNKPDFHSFIKSDSEIETIEEEPEIIETAGDDAEQFVIEDEEDTVVEISEDVEEIIDDAEEEQIELSSEQPEEKDEDKKGFMYLFSEDDED